MNLYKEALVALLSGLTTKKDGWIKWKNKYDSDVWVKGIDEDRYICRFLDGSKTWYLNGKCHRSDGPAVECSSGDRKWYLNGKLHREDGPAVEYSNGSKTWWVKGKLHRIDGPAVEDANDYKEWWVKGIFIKNNS